MTKAIELFHFYLALLPCEEQWICGAVEQKNIIKSKGPVTCFWAFCSHLIAGKSLLVFGEEILFHWPCEGESFNNQHWQHNLFGQLFVHCFFDNTNISNKINVQCEYCDWGHRRQSWPIRSQVNHNTFQENW